MQELPVRNDNGSKVIKLSEIIAIVLLFVTILVGLYPKDKLENQVLSEQSNYDLTAIYLQNLIRMEPKNSNLMIAMIKTSIERENFDLSYSLLDVLKNDTSFEVQKESLFLSLKIRYGQLMNEKDVQKQNKFKNEIHNILETILTNNLHTKDNDQLLYNAAVAIGDKKSAFNFIRSIVSEDSNLSNRSKWLKNCHYLSVEVNDDDQNYICVKELLKIEDDKKVWIEVLSKLRQFTKEDIDKISKSSMLEKKDQLSFYFSAGLYDDYISQYSLYFDGLTNHKEKKESLSNLIKKFQAADRGIDIVEIVKKHEAVFLNDRKMANKLLKFYMGTAKIDYAKSFSLQLLKQKDIK
jgi:hypothetical protein